MRVVAILTVGRAYKVAAQESGAVYTVTWRNPHPWGFSEGDYTGATSLSTDVPGSIFFGRPERCGIRRRPMRRNGQVREQQIKAGGDHCPKSTERACAKSRACLCFHFGICFGQWSRFCSLRGVIGSCCSPCMDGHEASPHSGVTRAVQRFAPKGVDGALDVRFRVLCTCKNRREM